MEIKVEMKLKEIEMDLPYRKNDKFIQQMQMEGMKYEEAVRKDYDMNWKKIRREFQLMTRCMTAMIERIMLPTDTKDCWKLLIECVEENTDNNYKNLLGVYVIQVPLEIETFFSAEDYDKKKDVINKIIEAINKLSMQITFELTSIYDACMTIINNNYVNEWIWKKALKIHERSIQIKIRHDVNKLRIYMLILDKYNTVLEQNLLIDTIPDERIYGAYLGKLEKISENEVALITKSGEKFVQIVR